MNNTNRALTVQKPCTHGLINKKAMKSFDFTAFFGAMEGTRTPGLLIRSQSLYPAELPTHTFRSEHDVFYHSNRVLSTTFSNYFLFFAKDCLLLLSALVFVKPAAAPSASCVQPGGDFVPLFACFCCCFAAQQAVRGYFWRKKPCKNGRTGIFYDFSYIVFVFLVL